MVECHWQKKTGGIIEITKTCTALSRWALSYNMRSHISRDTRAMYDLDHDEAPVHNESTKERQKKDSLDEELDVDPPLVQHVC